MLYGILIFALSVLTMFLVKVSEVRRTNEFGVQMYNTATGAVFAMCLRRVIWKVAQIVCVFSVLGIALVLFTNPYWKWY